MKLLIINKFTRISKDETGKQAFGNACLSMDTKFFSSFIITIKIKNTSQNNNCLSVF